MLRNILLKTLRDQRRALGWWSVGIVTLVCSVLPFYPSMRDNAQYNQLLDTLPEQLRAVLLAGAQDITSPAGYLNSQLFSLLVPLLLLIYAIGFGANTIAGEEERHTLELLLAHPLRRGQVVIEKFGALVLAVALLGLVLWLSLWSGALLVDMAIGVGKLASATLGGVLLGILFGALALALGAATGNRGLSGGVAAALAFGSYLLYSFSTFVERLEPYREASPFTWYIGDEPLRNGLQVGHVAALVGTTLVLLALAVWTFNRRDVAV